jgi:hypothetical protein
MELEQVPPEERGAFITTGFMVLRHALAEVIRRLPPDDRAAIQASLLNLRWASDELNADHAAKSRGEALMHYTETHVRLLLLELMDA